MQPIETYFSPILSTGVAQIIPSSPPFLRYGSKFHGTQQCENQLYDVQVETKHVDMRESFLCGYLSIKGQSNLVISHLRDVSILMCLYIAGLTADHSTLTTYFEGEIIGSKYSFLTQHEEWGSDDMTDMQHWAKFQAFSPFAKQAKKSNFQIPNLAQQENIFMRWKEHFLVPDHRVRTITGASFEGFYYICFNQCQGTISGIYFQPKDEKYVNILSTQLEICLLRFMADFKHYN
jgi:glucose-induced degradation protein 4